MTGTMPEAGDKKRRSTNFGQKELKESRKEVDTIVGAQVTQVLLQRYTKGSVRYTPKGNPLNRPPGLRYRD